MRSPTKLFLYVAVSFLFVPGFVFAQQENTTPKTVQSPQFVQVNKTNPHYLQYQDGSTFIPIGPNICWPRVETEEEKVLAYYEATFKKLAAYGGNYTRIWLSAPFFEVEYVQAYNYDFKKVERLDKLVSLAEKHGIKIKFCFENFRQLLNKPAPFVGSVPFDKPIYALENGGPLKTMDDYFQTKEGKDLYQHKLEFFANRYRNNPSVMGWELWNEINSVNIGNKPASIVDWTNEMLAEGHSKFPHQLVMQSMGSYDGERQESMYKAMVSLKGNDIAQVHRYLDPGAQLEACKGPMDVLAADAVNILLKHDLNKPVILSEVGAVEAHHAGPSKLYEKDSEGVLLHDLLFAPFFSGAAAPGQSWHWHYYIDKQNLWWHFGRFANAIKDFDPAIENAKPLYNETNELRIYGLKGGTKSLIWCRDKSSDWNTELVVGKKATLLKHKTLDLSKYVGKDASITVDSYLPWEDVWVSVKVKKATVQLPDFKRSIVLRVHTN